MKLCAFSRILVVAILACSCCVAEDEKAGKQQGGGQILIIYDSIPEKKIMFAVGTRSGDVRYIAWADTTSGEVKTEKNSTPDDRRIMIDVNLNPINIRLAKPTIGSSLVLRLNDKTLSTNDLKNVDKRFPGKDGAEERFVMAVVGEDTLSLLPAKLMDFQTFDPAVIVPKDKGQ